MTSGTARPAIGTLLKDWRRRRHLSQFELALDAGVSARHLSFVETGRSRPSPEMIVRLAEQLDVPLRECNQLLLAGGYALVYGQRDLQNPQMGPVRAIERVLAGHDPYPAVVVDRHWGMVAANQAIALLTDGVAEHLLAPPVNVLRLGLHPEGLAARIINHGEWRAHLLDRLHRQSVASADPALTALHAELAAYPVGDHGPRPDLAANEIAVVLRLAHSNGELKFISTVATFGTAVDVTMSELAIESFYPADAATAEFLHAWARRNDG
jgi:transcriptional regulator with XRE-family HTH domain